MANALVLTDGRIRTLADGRVTEAIAISGTVILAVGSNCEMRALAGPDADVVGLRGATVLPGFIDVHNHHALAGRTELFELKLPAGASFSTILEAVARAAAPLGPDEWIVGGSWSSTLGPRLGTLAARNALDSAAGGRPVLLNDDSRHNRWASRRALELAAIDDRSTDPPGGRIVRDAADPTPTGLLFESAGIAVEHALTAHRRLTPDQHAAASAEGIRLLHQHGITAFQDAAATLEILTALAHLDTAGRLDAWVVSSLLVNDAIFGADPIGAPLLERGEQFRTKHHRPDFVKIFLDGVPPTRTSAFLEPYLPDDEHGIAFRGSLSMSPGELRDWLLRTADTGLGAKIHCTGDWAVRAALDAVESVRAAGYDAPIYQIAHGQFVHPDDIPRFARLGVIADISPFLWVPGVIPDAIRTVLPEARARRMQPNRDLLDAGAIVAGGSDWPVSESPDPLEAIEGLVTRRDPNHRSAGALWAEQAVTLDEAVRAFTSDAASAIGLGAVTGSLLPGLSADLVILDEDPWSVPSDRIAQIGIRATWFEGRPVHTA